MENREPTGQMGGSLGAAITITTIFNLWERSSASRLYVIFVAPDYSCNSGIQLIVGAGVQISMIELSALLPSDF